MAQNFIQGAIKHPGALHAQLGVAQGTKIPAGVFDKIKNAAIGDTIKVGSKSIKVTALLKKRASLGKTLSTLRKKKQVA